MIVVVGKVSLRRSTIDNTDERKIRKGDRNNNGKNSAPVAPTVAASSEVSVRKSLGVKGGGGR